MRDFTMPILDGNATFTELRRLDPDGRISLMSGFNEQDAVRRFVGKCNTRLHLPTRCPMRATKPSPAKSPWAETALKIARSFTASKIAVSLPVIIGSCAGSWPLAVNVRD
jgi:hypothetical protein